MVVHSFYIFLVDSQWIIFSSRCWMVWGCLGQRFQTVTECRGKCWVVPAMFNSHAEIGTIEGFLKSWGIPKSPCVSRLKWFISIFHNLGDLGVSMDIPVLRTPPFFVVRKRGGPFASSVLAKRGISLVAETIARSLKFWSQLTCGGGTPKFFRLMIANIFVRFRKASIQQMQRWYPFFIFSGLDTACNRLACF